MGTGRNVSSVADSAGRASNDIGLRSLVLSVRQELLGAEDSICLERARLVTEAWRQHEHEPAGLRRARAFEHVLRHMTLDVTSNPIFAGNTSSKPRAWMLVPEHGFAEPAQVIHENDGLAGILHSGVPADLRDFWRDRSLGGNSDKGHLAVDLHTVVHVGLEALIARVDSLHDAGTPAQRAYRTAMRICLTAVIEWAGRYANTAARAARTASDPLVRSCLERMSKACRQVPARPARNLFEGLQAIVLVHLALALEGHGMSVSIGLPDRVLARFVASNLDETTTTALIGAFMLKITANSVFGRGSKTQAVTVGGADARGRDCSNRLTRCFLDAADLVRVGDPHLFLRWHPRLAPSLKSRAADLLAAGLSMPLLIHDNPTAQGFVNAGVAPEDAWQYCVIGCNELGIPGLAAESANARAGNVLYLEILNQLLLDHPSPDSVSDTNALLDILETALERRLRAARKHCVEAWRRLPEAAPVPFTSALMHGCIEAGDDMVRAMKYRIPGLFERQLTNAANALAAIDRQVFRERTATLSQLVDAMKNDYRSAAAECLRRSLLTSPRWGNDEPAADAWAMRLLDMRECVLDRIDREFGHNGHIVCHVVRSLHHLDGKRTGASPDGRHAGRPVADSIGAGAGEATRGPTAVLNSVARIDACTYYRGGYNLNITLPAGRTRANVLLPLIEGFFRRGGQELQVNCLDAERLRDAQHHPERHGDLLVRFAGLSSRFVDLSRVEQDELIARAEAIPNP
ncbi:MAG: hypothetical protein GXP31_17025 [Kiritimatiellaeota bacterium]|nr:hypothetical protein [Kiritimatiellota bacterium]